MSAETEAEQLEADIGTIATTDEEVAYLRERLVAATGLRRIFVTWRIERMAMLIRRGMIGPGLPACMLGNWP